MVVIRSAWQDELYGDLNFRIMHKAPLKDQLVCRFAVNTAFVQNSVVFTKANVDPDSIRNDQR